MSYSDAPQRLEVLTYDHQANAKKQCEQAENEPDLLKRL